MVACFPQPHRILRLLWLLVLVSTCCFVLPSHAKPRTRNPKLKHRSFASIEYETQASAHSFLHNKDKTPVVFPLEINVVLVGLAGDAAYRYDVDQRALANLLASSFPEHRPSCLETGQQLEIKYQMFYNVLGVATDTVEAMERNMREMMRAAGSIEKVIHGAMGQDAEDWEVYDIDAERIEAEYSRVYNELFGVNRETNTAAAIFITNFDKTRMDPRKPYDLKPYSNLGSMSAADMVKQESDYVYRYRYNGAAPTATWLSSQRFVVMDLSAGPCTYGRTGVAGGIVAPRTIPRLAGLLHPALSTTMPAPDKPLKDAQFRGKLSALVVSAVQHLFAPDIRTESPDFAHRVLVPILVLRDHSDFHPLLPGHNASIDVLAVEEEIQRLTPSNQNIVVVGAVHALQDIEPLAMALAKAMPAESSPSSNSQALQERNSTTTTLNSRVLLEELRQAGDTVTARLLRATHPGAADTFYAAPTLDQLHAASLTRQANSPKHFTYNYGMRVLPVFVFSVGKAWHNLLLDDQSLVAASRDAVIVLQTPAEAIPLGFSSESELQYARPINSTQHLVAGVAMALGGLTAPYERISQIKGQREETWLWAMGHHPFGPFTNSTRLSQLHVDIAHRNAILSRADTALRSIRQALEHIQEFAETHLADPFGQRIEKLHVRTPQMWLDRVFRDPGKTAPPLPYPTVQRLEQQLQGLEEQLVKLGELLWKHDMDQAYRRSGSILTAVRLFEDVVEQELAKARESLKLCRIEYKHAGHSLQLTTLASIVIAGALVYGGVMFFVRTASKED